MRTIREDKGLGAVEAGPDATQPAKYFAIRFPNQRTRFNTAVVSLTDEQVKALRDEADAWLNRPQGFWWRGTFVDSKEKLADAFLRTPTHQLSLLKDVSKQVKFEDNE